MAKPSGPLDYREITDALFTNVTHGDMAELMKLPRSRVAHARLPTSSAGIRPPPNNWEFAALRLAKARLAQLEKLVTKLEKHLEHRTPQ
jgi:hypothetical protein